MKGGSQNVLPGQRIEVELSPDAGFPVHIQIGNDRQAAFIEKIRTRPGLPVKVVAWRMCPNLGEGVHQVTVHDRNGVHSSGSVTIRR